MSELFEWCSLLGLPLPCLRSTNAVLRLERTCFRCSLGNEAFAVAMNLAVGLSFRVRHINDPFTCELARVQASWQQCALVLE